MCSWIYRCWLSCPRVFGLSHIWYYGIAFLFILFALIANLLGIRATGGFALVLSGIVLALLIATITFSLPEIRAVHLHSLVYSRL